MLGRRLITIATGAVFTLVGVGLAYAVPNSLGGARPPGRAHLTLIEVRGASGAEDGRREFVGTGSGVERNEPAGSRPRGPQGARENHGAAVRVAAHCDMRGRAHGELVRSIAGEEDATVAEAAAACEAAQAGGSEPGTSGGSSKKDRPSKPSKPSKPSEADKAATKDKPTPDKSAKPGKPAKPKPPKPAKPAPPDKPAKRAQKESAPPQEEEPDPEDKGPKKN
jgi:hypothetical protein